MQKLVVLMMALFSLSSFAQRGPGRDNSGSITMNNGRDTVRIRVGDTRDDRDMLRRLVQLERAVQDLQIQVYQLQSAPRPMPIPRRSYVACTASYTYVGTFSGRGNTEVEARTALAAACLAASSEYYCRKPSGEILCERGEEY